MDVSRDPADKVYAHTSLEDTFPRKIHAAVRYRLHKHIDASSRKDMVRYLPEAWVRCNQQVSAIEKSRRLRNRPRGTLRHLRRGQFGNGKPLESPGLRIVERGKAWHKEMKLGDIVKLGKLIYY